MVALVLIILVVEFAFRLKSYLLRRFHPDTVVVGYLLAAPEKVNGPQRDWLTLNKRKRIMEDIEQVADSLERGLARQLRAGDAVTDFWTRERGIEASAAMRSLKRWVITPRADTSSHLKERLSRDLTLVVSGDWDLLEGQQPEKLSRGQRLKRVIEVVRTILVGSLPFAGLL